MPPGDLSGLLAYLGDRAEDIERDKDGGLIGETLQWVPEELHGQWRRQWLNAFEKGTRQLVPALVDIHQPGLAASTSRS